MGVFQPLVVAGLLGQIREHVVPVGAAVDMPDPAAFAVIAQQRLGHGQGDQLAVGQQGLASPSSARRDHVIVDHHVECGQEGV
jgi:hypothetical protein